MLKGDHLGTAVTNFGHWSFDIQVADLYRFIDVYKRQLYKLMKAISVPDLFAIVMGLCAIGLIVIPELVYVRDIYENGNARANTMFKLTYQA